MLAVILLAWVFDAYYLWMERRFRHLYNDRINHGSGGTITSKDFNPTNAVGVKYLSSFISITTVPYYSALGFIVLLNMI